MTDGHQKRRVTDASGGPMPEDANVCDPMGRVESVGRFSRGLARLVRRDGRGNPAAVLALKLLGATFAVLVAVLVVAGLLTA